MSILDISNWTINEIRNSINTFKDTSLADIGMVNCDIESINIVGEVTTATLWIDEDVGIDGYTGTAPLKIYKEDKIEIKLNSPLLEGDTIEVVDGKLCHVHRYEKITLDGSEDEKILLETDTLNTVYTIRFTTVVNSNLNSNGNQSSLISEFPITFVSTYNFDTESLQIANQFLYIRINKDKLPTEDVSGFKQWLSENPLTTVYQLDTPTYEDITPLQSSITLKTFLESSMIIDTNLPIETKLSYRTNVPSISTLSTRATELAESDNVIHNLMNIIDDEVDE